MLMSPRARSTGVGFMVGWVLGVAVAALMATLVLTQLHVSDGEVSTWSSLLRLLLGALLLGYAVRKFRAPSGAETLPAWMQAVDRMPVSRAIVLAAALAALNPKNLAMVIAAADEVAGAEAGRSTILGAFLVFVIVASVSVAGPVISYLVAPARMADPLQRLKEWLVVHNGSVMATLLLVFGTVLVGKGVAGLGVLSVPTSRRVGG